ncbi:MAG: LysR family transcriptional regulator [Xylophilus ampelinus]
MQKSRNVLTPESLHMLQRIAVTGSFAAAAREMGLVPSALTYRVRQVEEILDVLLFDRSNRQARPTEAGAELLREGGRLLAELDAVAHRVRRVATGWEPEFTIATDGVIAREPFMELVERFLQPAPPTRMRLRDEILTGTIEAVDTGRADLALGVLEQLVSHSHIQVRPLGELPFVYAVAPSHPLARAPQPVEDRVILQHRAVAVADSAVAGSGMTVGLLAGQDVLTVSSMQAKIDAQLRGLGSGFLPEPMARPHLQSGRLVALALARPPRVIRMGYAWREGGTAPSVADPLADPRPPASGQGRALRWWLEHLARPVTRDALLGMCLPRAEALAAVAEPLRG